MVFVAITGGIGSGKSHVCRLLEQRGISVYDCDAAAKRLIVEDEEIRQRLTQLVGDTIYNNGRLQKRVLAEFLLHSPGNQLAVDEIVHPAVARDFLRSGKTWIESAILFDSGFDKRLPLDFAVGVMAPLEVRIARVMQRDGISREKTLKWIGRQWPQEEVASRCQFIIHNDGLKNLNQQIDELINQIQTFRKI